MKRRSFLEVTPLHRLQNITPREWLIAVSMAFSLGWALLAVLVFVRAIMSPALTHCIYVEEPLVIPEALLVWVGTPVMLAGYLTIAKELRDDVARRIFFSRAGIDTVDT